MNRIRQAHELRRCDRVLIHRDFVNGADVATICAVADASFAGADLVDVSYQFSHRAHARVLRVHRETSFAFLGSYEELKMGAIEFDETATTMRFARQS
jgi:hypothetical protein